MMRLGSDVQKPVIVLLLALWGLLFASNACAENVVNYLVVEDKTRPFQIVEKGESRGGIVSDMVDAIFADSDYTVRHRVFPVNRLRKVIANNELDHWIAYDAPQWDSFGEHGQFVDVPVLNTHHVLLTCREDLPARIDSIRQIEGLRILTLRHFDYVALDRAAAKGTIRQLPIDRYEAGIQLVSLGRADGFVEMESRLQFHVGQHAEVAGPCLRWLDFSAIIPDFPLYLTVDSDWPPEFAAFVAERIRSLQQSGAFDRITTHYLGSDDGQDFRPVAQ
ncbi:substrate-binding periplasmic protein [Marinobacter bohaiensis]|uniref:substrate-binding periplasmic protein n=1 Tax=Marinobacter bohaiensis TaxID=2201898 RepID=UPI0013A6E0AB|nr:transporter substrate-binding domain-containing protein [Marinobacter bohaiensis]